MKLSSGSVLSLCCSVSLLVEEFLELNVEVRKRPFDGIDSVMANFCLSKLASQEAFSFLNAQAIWEFLGLSFSLHLSLSWLLKSGSSLSIS